MLGAHDAALREQVRALREALQAYQDCRECDPCIECTPKALNILAATELKESK
jgi:predicted aldo/keto reductase-like oxidoreductase